MTVLKHTNGNIGGVNPIQYIFKEDVQSFVINPSTLAGTLTLKPGRSWNYLYGSPDSIEVAGKEELQASGMKYSYDIKMMVPKDRPDVEMILMLLNYQHLIINVVDKNGVSRYYGTVDCPMRKISNLMKPATVEGYHGWQVVFSGQFALPAAYQELAGLPNVIPAPDGS